MLVMFLVPVPRTSLTDSSQFDKAVHFGSFLGFSLLFYLDRAPRVARTLLISFAFAAGIELVQWFLPYREADWWDFLAGAAGACMGSLLLRGLQPKLQRNDRER